MIGKEAFGACDNLVLISDKLIHPPSLARIDSEWMPVYRVEVYPVVLATGMSWSTAPYCIYACIQSTCGWSVDIAPAVEACEQTDNLQLENVAAIITLSDAGSPSRPHTFF